MTDPDKPRPRGRSHLTPFREGPRPWLVLARNAVPVIGVYGLGWSAEAVLFQLWFSGVAALGAMLAWHLRAFVITAPQHLAPPPGMPRSVMPGVLAAVWLLLWLLLGIPYWFVLALFGLAVFDGAAWGRLAGDVGLAVSLAAVLGSHVLEEASRGYERMGEAAIRLEFNWDLSMHLARAAAMLLVTFILRAGLLLGLALALSYVEIYPLRALRFFGGDRTLDEGNVERSRD